MKNRSDAEHSAKMKKVQAAQAKKLATKTIEKGLVIVHTGPGKGKSSAAFGMAVRAIGHGMKVGVVQFVKGAMETGEKAVFDRFPDLIAFKPMGEGFTWNTQDRARDIAAAAAAWAISKEMIADPELNFVLLDELNIALRYEYLDIKDVLAALAVRPMGKHICITGRNAHPDLIEMADLVTEMKAIKHPFEKGMKVQKGVDF